MKASELIEKLNALVAEHGDCDVRMAYGAIDLKDVIYEYDDVEDAEYFCIDEVMEVIG